MAERPRLLFAWELGDNFGHAGKIVCVARALADRYDVFIAAKNPGAIRQMAPDLDARLLPAPVVKTRNMQPDEAPGASFPGMLLQDGWDDPATLAPFVEAWWNLFDLVEPDVLIAQAAPTALLAARGLEMRRVILGSGYDNPPCATPMPLLFPEQAGAADTAARQEAMALATANATLEAAGQPAMAHFCDLLKVDLSLLVTWPELDHYEDRDALQPDLPPFIGPLAVREAGTEVGWVGRDGPRIFAYLRPGSPQSVAAFGALLAMAPRADIVIASPGIIDKEADLLRGAGAQVIDGPVRLAPLLERCDLGISHAGNGTATALLLAGVPQLFLPTQMEQTLFARTLGRRGFGLGIGGRYGKAEVAQAIDRVLGSREMQRRIDSALEGIRAHEETPAEVLAARAVMALCPPAA